MNRTSASAGFTLVETLASLAVLAMLSLMLVLGAQFGRRTLMRAEGGQGAAIEAAQTLLRSRLQRAFPYAHPNSGFPTVDFDGAADRIQFYAPPPDSVGPDALQHFALSLTPGGDLRLSMVSDLANDPAQPARMIPLLSGVASVELSYFGLAAPETQPRWRAVWRQQANLPRLVRVRVGFPPGDRRVWPDLIIAPAATLDSLCQIEVNTGQCRGRS